MLLRVKPTVFLQRFASPGAFSAHFLQCSLTAAPPLLLPRPRSGGCRGVGAALRGCSLKAATPARSDTITALLDVVGGTPLHPRRSLLKLGGTTQRPVLPPAPPASHKATEGGQRLHPQSLHPPPRFNAAAVADSDDGGGQEALGHGTLSPHGDAAAISLTCEGAPQGPRTKAPAAPTALPLPRADSGSASAPGCSRRGGRNRALRLRLTLSRAHRQWPSSRGSPPLSQGSGQPPQAGLF